MDATSLLSLCLPAGAGQRVALASALQEVGNCPPGAVEILVEGSGALLGGGPGLRRIEVPSGEGLEAFRQRIRAARGELVWILGPRDLLLPGSVAQVLAARTQGADVILVDALEGDVRTRRFQPRSWFKQPLPGGAYPLADGQDLIDCLGRMQYEPGAFWGVGMGVFSRDRLRAALRALPPDLDSGYLHGAAMMACLAGPSRLHWLDKPMIMSRPEPVSGPEELWQRLALDQAAWTRIARGVWPGQPNLAEACLDVFRRGTIRSLSIAAGGDPQAWAVVQDRLRAMGFDSLLVNAMNFAHDILMDRMASPQGLAAPGSCLADLPLVARGARRIAVLAEVAPGEHEAASRWLGALRLATRAETIRVLCGPDLAALLAGFDLQVLDWTRFPADAGYQAAQLEAIRAYAPDLLVDLGRDRGQAGELLAVAAAASAALGFGRQLPAVDPAEPDDATRMLRSRTFQRLVPAGAPLAALAEALGLAGSPAFRALAGADIPSTDLSNNANLPETELSVRQKLNLGCGQEHLAGWVNVDQFPGAHPDVIHDLEQLPWPFPDDCAEEVLLKHVLEHLGRDSATFLAIVRELYRVCAPGARVRIVVPHPRHRDFLQDPTHVRPVLAEMFEHFSLDINEDWQRRGLPGTPLAQYLGLDFQIESATLNLDPWWDAEFHSGRITRPQLDRAMRDCNDVVQTTEIVLRARKPFRGPAAATRVRWQGSQFVHHSLAHVNRQLCLGLLASGRAELSLVPYELDQFDGSAVPAFRPLAAALGRPLSGPAAVHVRHQWPPDFNPPAEGAWVMIQPWEFGGIPVEWVAPMRDLVDEVWVPSTWLKDCYVRSGVPADQVVVVPNGVDGAVFRPDGEPLPLKTTKTCKFLFVGGTIHRKGFDLLLAAYVKTFRATDDVCLVIKEQGGGIYGDPGLPRALRQLRRDDPQAPEIEYHTENLTEPQMAALYRACDVLVLPYRGEGFGLPLAEAMASGLPVLATGRGAAQDFLRPEWAYLIPSRNVPVDSPGGYSPSPAGFWLEEPDPTFLAALLTRAFNNPEERRAMGRRGREHALAALGWDRPVAMMLERLAALAARVPRRLAPATPAPAGPEAFLYRPDWAKAEWVEVLLSYLLAFKPGDPVALVLPWAGTPGEPGLAEIQTRLLTLAQGAGVAAFADVVLVDQPLELAETLAGYGTVTVVPSGRGSVEGLQGPYGLRLAAARTRLCQG